MALPPLSAPRLPRRCEDRTALCVRAFPGRPHPRRWALSSPGTSPPGLSSPLLSPVTNGSPVLCGNGSRSRLACAAQRPEVGLPGAELPTEQGKQRARGLLGKPGWRAGDIPGEQALGGSCMPPSEGTPPHLQPAAMQPGEKWFWVCSALSPNARSSCAPRTALHGASQGREEPAPHRGACSSLSSV